MVYIKTDWVDGTTPVNATNLDHLEQGVEDAHNLLIPDTLIDAAGDLIVGSAADTPVKLAAPTTNGHVLTADLAEAGKMKWAAAAAAGGATYVRLSRRSDFALPAATTPIQWDTQDYDPTDMFNIANPTRIVFPVVGWYRIAAEITLSTGAASPTLDVRHNASITVASRQWTGTWLSFSIDFEDSFGSGGYIEIRATLAAARTMTFGWIAVQQIA